MTDGTALGLTVDDVQEPAGWSTARLGSVLREVNHRSRDEVRTDLPVLSLTKNRGLIVQSDRFDHRVARENTDDYKVVQKGVLVYNPYVIWEGAIHVLRTLEAGLVSPAYLTWDVEHADSRFIDYVIRTPKMLQEFSRLSSGVVQRRRSINKRAFVDIELSLPSHKEQEGIADALEVVENAVIAAGRVVSALHIVKQSLLRHLFVYGPTPLSLASQVPMRDSDIGEVPEHWAVEPVGDVLEQAQYGVSSRGGPSGTHPILRMNSLMQGHVVLDKLQYVTLSPAVTAKYLLRTGDILFNRTNSFALVGKTALFDLPGEYVFASYLVRLTTKATRMNPAFLNFYLNADLTQRRLKLLATRGVSQSNINANKLKGLLVPVPPLDEQEKIVAVLSAVEASLGAEKDSHWSVSQYFESAKRALTSGVRRVQLPGGGNG